MMDVIHGLKSIVNGLELRQLCNDRAAALRSEAVALAAQADAMPQEVTVTNMGKSSSQPNAKVAQTRIKATRSVGEAAELDFIANHVAVDTLYVLDAMDLRRLGVSK